MLRVVLDTNVLLSACLKPQGLEALLVRLVLAGQLHAFVTEQVLAEYRDVLLRPKFAAVRERAIEILTDFERAAERITAGDTLTIATDDDDNRILECAVAAGAKYLVTGNLRHYPAEWAGVRVINARRFAEAEAPIAN